MSSCMNRLIDYFHDTRNTIGLAWHSWVEAIVIVLVALVASFTLNPQDPLFIDASFPWLTFILLIIALQYSIGPTLIALAMTLCAFCYKYAWDALSLYSHQLFLFGMAMLSLIANQCRSSWHNRVRQANATSFYTRERINRLLNDFYMLRYSHDCLEQSVMLKPITMRDALKEIRQLSIGKEGEFTEEIGTPLLQILASHFRFTKAQITLYNDKQFDKKAICTLGEASELDPEDILIKRAVKEKKAQYFAANQFEKESHGQFLATLPLRNADEGLVGMLCIEDMPFLSLNHENLTIMSVLLNYFTDEMSAVQTSISLLKRHPECCPQLAKSLMKLQTLYTTIGVESSLVAFHFDNIENRKEIIRHMYKRQRGLDETWELESKKVGEPNVLLVMMPFTDLQGVAAYLEHRKEDLKEQFNLEIGENGPVQVIYHAIRFQNLNDLYEEMVPHHAS